MSDAAPPSTAGTIRPTMLRPPAPTPAWQVAVGVLLTLPALALLVISYVVPAAWTVWASFQRINPLGDDASGVGGRNYEVGGRNYEKVFDDGLAGDVGFALSLAAELLLVVVLAIGYLVTWVVRAQDLLWPLLAGRSERRTGPAVLVQALQQYDVDRLPYGAVMPVVVLVVLVLLALAAQLLYLDRVALRVGLPERDHPPRT
jgi:ABC-type sugar transport system permease subunit